MAATRTARKPHAERLQDAVAEKLPAELARRLPDILTTREEKKLPVFSQRLQAVLAKEDPTAQDCLYSLRRIAGFISSDLPLLEYP